MSNIVNVTVHSEPATFATKREREFKQAIVQVASTVESPKDITN